MARPTKEQPQETINSQSIALSYLKQNKDDHYNFEKSNDYLVKNSSMLLNLEIPGLTPGCHRFVGFTTGGKTSCSLDYLFNFLNDQSDKGERRGVYFKSEGRLSPQIKERSGVNFTHDPQNWNDRTCLVVESNIHETIFGLIKELITNNPNSVKYFFIIDSMDNMIRKADLEKPLGDATLVSGGAVLTSVFLKKVGNALEKRGHIAIFISQVRDEIKIGYAPAGTPRQGKASGGHAIEHNASIVLEFLPRFGDEVIRENEKDKSSKILGHRCKVKILKDDNEKQGTIISYPICYGRKNGTSVWIEREVSDMLLLWGWLVKSGGWFNFKEDIYSKLKEIDPECPEKIQGEDNIRQMLTDRPLVLKYFLDNISKCHGILKDAIVPKLEN